MQQIIYRNATVTDRRNPDRHSDSHSTRRPGLTQWIGQKWDLVGVLALMASSAAYGVFALSHLA